MLRSAIRAGPAVQFTDPSVAFGLVQLGKHVTQPIIIHNTSGFSSATWTLHALPQQASGSSVISSNSAAKHAKQAADTGMPAVLEAKQQLLLQQLQEAQMTEQGTASEADESTSTTVAKADVIIAAQSTNPFEGSPPAEEEDGESRCRLFIEPECGILGAGASASVQVSRSP